MVPKKIDEFRFRLERRGGMRVAGLLFASERMLAKIEAERVLSQVANVAHLPGIVGHSLAMPDCHWGYGAPVGGVAATDLRDGVVSPGLVGFDISCGVRLLSTDLQAADVRKHADRMMDALFAAVPAGVGRGGSARLSREEVRRVLARGARWAVERGQGSPGDLERSEDGGVCAGAEPDEVSDRAVERGRDQVGSLGSGNHFLELQEVDAVYDPAAAEAFGLRQGQMTVLLHSGSRGLGYQVCADSLKEMQGGMRRHGIVMPDRQLACVPVGSEEGRRYLGAMGAASNFARANRQVLTDLVRAAVMEALGMGPRDLGMRVVYDLSHNIARIEMHRVDGRERALCVHRKGATRAFPAGHPSVPQAYRAVGQPVLVPGSMGTCSYVLAGTGRAMLETFGTVCHGAGRVLSRTQAARQMRGDDICRRLLSQGIHVRTDSYRGLAEEAPAAYKDVADVVAVCEGAGLALRVARMRPFGVLKG